MLLPNLHSGHSIAAFIKTGQKQNQQEQQLSTCFKFKSEFPNKEMLNLTGITSHLNPKFCALYLYYLVKLTKTDTHLVLHFASNSEGNTLLLKLGKW